MRRRLYGARASRGSGMQRPRGRAQSIMLLPREHANANVQSRHSDARRKGELKEEWRLMSQGVAT